MGLVLSSISNTLYQGEKFAICFMITAITWCLVATLIITLGMGIGLGYNYCFVDIKTKFKYIAPRVRYPPPPDIEDKDTMILRRNRKYTPYPYQYRSPGYRGYPYYPNPYPDPGSIPLKTFGDEQDPTLPNLSGYDPNTVSTISNASDILNKITVTPPPLNETTTSTSDASVKITLKTKPTLIVNTTEVSTTMAVTNTTENITTIEVSTEKVDKEEGLPKMSIPISGLDLIGLLSRLRAENRNYTLQIVT